MKEEVNIIDIKNTLTSSPLYNLSLANKELFHSNFLAWVGNKYKNSFKWLFTEELKLKWPKNLEKFSVEREDKHFDITVVDDDRSPKIIIENKVKSVPTKEQLERYRNTQGCNNCLFILMTMTSALHNQDNANGWKIVTYDMLSSALSNLYDKLNQNNSTILDKWDSYHLSLLDDYIVYIENLQKIINYFDTEDALLESSNDSIKKELRIHDICGKRKAQILFQKLVERLQENKYEVVNDEKYLSDNNLKVGWGYTDKPVVEVKFKINEDYLVIQIQGNQYRHAVEYFDETINKRIEKKGKSFGPSKEGITYLVENYNDLFCFQNNEPKHYPFKADKFGQRANPGYCKYCNGKIGSNNKISCFVYQWVEIPNNLKIDELVSYVLTDVSKILSLFKNCQS